MKKKNFMQLLNKNVKINVWFDSRSKLFSVTFFVTAIDISSERVQQYSAELFCDDFPAYLFSMVEITCWNLFPCPCPCGNVER
jgi:hypothetical protein